MKLSEYLEKITEKSDVREHYKELDKKFISIDSLKVKKYSKEWFDDISAIPMIPFEVDTNEEKRQERLLSIEEVIELLNKVREEPNTNYLAGKYFRFVETKKWMRQKTFLVFFSMLKEEEKLRLIPKELHNKIKNFEDLEFDAFRELVVLETKDYLEVVNNGKRKE